MDNRTVIGSRINSALAFSNKKQKELAAHLGIPDNTISYFCSGKRVPNAEQIIEIAKFLNVSADYLLGLTDNKTTDIDLQAVCKYTGLNENAIENIRKYYDLHSYDSDYFDILNWLLSQSYILDIVFELRTLKRNSIIYLDMLKKIEKLYPDGMPIDFYKDLDLLNLPQEVKNYGTVIEIAQICDVSRYKIIKTAEKISNYFDQREQVHNKGDSQYEFEIEFTKNLERLINIYNILNKAVEQNGEHNPPKE